MTNHPYIIAIAGGIGCGKSMISRIVAAMGYPVYDCDSQAKLLMDSSNEIKAAISSSIDSACIHDGVIDRAALAAIVFNDEEKLSRLNSIVHGAVRRHLSSWINDNSRAVDNNLRAASVNTGTTAGICFVETAILYQSGLDCMVDEVWNVDAPTDLRIQRVMKRNCLTREAVQSRISAQDSFTPPVPHPRTHLITNDGNTPLLPRIEQLIDRL